MNKLILGDNLEIMRKMDSETIDLIYLDPPFFSNRNYEVIWGDKGEIRSFEDRWSGGIDHYIAWLKERVAEMHRILKPSGSIYLHCDWHADAYIRVLILDKLFGEANFRNEIIWQRITNVGSSKSISSAFITINDSIFLYTKSKENKDFKFNKMYIPPSKEYKARFKDKDEHGYYYWNTLATYSQETYERLQKENKVRWTEGAKFPQYKTYLHELKGSLISNIWTDINMINPMAKERIGYPTQKPEKLLERIILASSNEGDIIFDPFLGGGTTVVVADRLNRQWLGIDQSVQAIKVSEIRLNKQQNLFSADFTVQLHKYDYDTLRHKDAFEFETWIIERFDGIANIKQRGDFGMDGRMRSGTPLQVKRSENIGRNVVDNFKSSCQRYDKNLFAKNKANAEPVGYIIAFSFGKGAIQEVARLQNEENIIIKLVEVESIVPIAKKPKLTVELKQISKDAKGMTEIEFTAIAESEAGIEFFAWDFEYNEEEKKFNAGIMLDREGRQTHKFKPGSHIIAVKAIDNEGLEAVEVLKVKVNGELEVGK